MSLNGHVLGREEMLVGAVQFLLRVRGFSDVNRLRLKAGWYLFCELGNMSFAAEPTCTGDFQEVLSLRDLDDMLLTLTRRGELWNRIQGSYELVGASSEIRQAPLLLPAAHHRVWGFLGEIPVEVLGTVAVVVFHERRCLKDGAHRCAHRIPPMIKRQCLLHWQKLVTLSATHESCVTLQ